MKTITVTESQMKKKWTNKTTNNSIIKIFIEITSDKGYIKKVLARDNKAEYVLTSARMHDLYSEYVNRYGQIPTARWYHRHARFEEHKL